MPRISPTSSVNANTASSSVQPDRTPPIGKSKAPSGTGPTRRPLTNRSMQPMPMSGAPRQSHGNHCWAAATEAAANTYGKKVTQDDIAEMLGLHQQAGSPKKALNKMDMGGISMKFEDAKNPIEAQQLGRQMVVLLKAQIEQQQHPVLAFIEQKPEQGGITWKHALVITGVDHQNQQITFSDPGRPSAQAHNETPLKASAQELFLGWKPYPHADKSETAKMEVTLKQLFTTKTPPASQSNSREGTPP